MKIDGFDWDSANSMKNENKHGISRESIELFFKASPRIAKEVLKYEQAFTKNENR